MANQAELLNKFIDLQKEVDNKIENKFNIESSKIETRLTEHKETIENNYRKITGTISNLKVDELRNELEYDEKIIAIKNFEGKKTYYFGVEHAPQQINV